MKVSVIGSGSWGTALAQVLADNNVDVLIYGRENNQVVDINTNHKNSIFFDDFELNHTLKATTNFDDLLNAEIFLLAVPTIAIEEICLKIKEKVNHPFYIINVAKGFHPVTYKRMSVVINETLKDSHLIDVISLIGPSHAEEVIKRMLTAVNAVCENEESAKMVQHLFSNSYLRVYTNTDVIGAELGVAIKNSIALASGMISGLGYGDNTRAALITRGLAEMTRYGIKCGGKMETYLGLCGLGDLIVTCTSQHSRNFQAGYAIGKANDATEFLKNNTKTVEGINTAKAIYHHAKEIDVDMPIVNQIYRVLFENAIPSICVEELMNRKLVPEIRE